VDLVGHGSNKMLWASPRAIDMDGTVVNRGNYGGLLCLTATVPVVLSMGELHNTSTAVESKRGAAGKQYHGISDAKRGNYLAMSSTFAAVHMCSLLHMVMLTLSKISFDTAASDLSTSTSLLICMPSHGSHKVNLCHWQFWAVHVAPPAARRPGPASCGMYSNSGVSIDLWT
jgi:hypothetical protein